MSLTTLASKLYTIKSRKNLSLSSAFGAMVKEDLAMRFSVYNLVKSLTRSDFIATVAQAKYGKRTPLEMEELKENRRKEKYLANSIANLNNRINTLAAITERNTALISNLYGEIGAFKSQKILPLNAIKDVSAVKIPMRSRTVKGQIDLLRKELDSVKQVKKPRTFRDNTDLDFLNKSKNKGMDFNLMDLSPLIRLLVPIITPAISAAVLAATSGAIKREVMRVLGFDESDIQGSNEINRVTDPWVAGAGAVAGLYAGRTAYKAAKGARNLISRISNRAAKPPVVPKPATAATTTKPIPTAKPATRIPSTPKAFKLPGFARLFGRLGSATKILGTGPQAIALIMQGAGEMASGRAEKEVFDKMQSIAKKFGIKFLRGPDGTPIYEINNTQYTSENLPPEYQTILDAYIGDTRSASARMAREKIAMAPGFYNSLVVEGPPISKETTATEIIAAAKSAKLSFAEPNIPTQTEVSLGAVSPMQKMAEKSVPLLPPTASYSPSEKADKETVKQIIVQAANMVGVDAGIMLAMGFQESKFDPNARPYKKDKKTGEMKLASSAKGLYQFLDSTWEEMVKKYGKSYPELKRGQYDPMASAIAGALYIKENSKHLKRKKIPITGTSIYATHFLGPGGAEKLLTASTNADAVSVLPDAAKANPSVFMNKDGSHKSVQEVIDFLYRKVGSLAETYTAQLKANPPPLNIQPGMVSTPPPIMVGAQSQQDNISTQTAITAVASNIKAEQAKNALVSAGTRIKNLETLQKMNQSFPDTKNPDPSFT